MAWYEAQISPIISLFFIPILARFLTETLKGLNSVKNGPILDNTFPETFVSYTFLFEASKWVKTYF